MANLLQTVASWFQSNGAPNQNGSQLLSGRKDLIKQALIAQYSGNKNPDLDLRKAELISTVYTCIKILSENVSRLPLYIYKDDGNRKSIYSDHAYYDQLRYNPQAWVNTKDWLTGIITCLYLRGNAYAYLDKDQFKILSPDDVEIGIYRDQLWYYSDSLKIPFSPDEILHFKLITKDPLSKGLNPIESLKTELNIQYKAEATVNNFYSNNAHGTKYLEQIADLGKTNNTKLAEIIEDWNNKYSGFDNSGSIIVVPPNFNLKELSLNANDVQFLESAKYSESSIGALFGIPQYLLGKNDYTGKYEEASLHFRTNTIAALLNVITSELEFKLLSLQERNAGVSIEFDVNALYAANLIDKSNILKAIAQQGALSPNEFRKAFNLPVSDNPALDKYYIQSQYVVLDDVANGQPKPAPLPPTDNNLNQEQDDK